MQKAAFSAPVMALMVLIAACSLEDGAGNAVRSAPAEIEIPYEAGAGYNAHFCRSEDCERILNYYLNMSEKSIHCAFYHAGIKSTLGILSGKSRMMDVKLVVDDSSKEVKGARVVKSFGLMHNKFCIIDGGIVVTGSLNPTDSELPNDNNLFVIYSRLLAENYDAEFNELWNGIYGKGEKTANRAINYSGILIENYFCPDDGCEEEVSAELKMAEKSIYFMAFSFTSEKIADSILFKDGIDIKGVMDSSSAGTKFSQYGRLRDFGIDVLKDKSKKLMHHKVFIIDGNTVITGSFNPTEGANKRNDENILIIHDPRIAEKYMEEFLRVWNLAEQEDQAQN